MKKGWAVLSWAGAALLLVGGARLQAQGTEQGGEQEDVGRHIQLGVGVGLVQDGSGNGSEFYSTASMRFRVGRTDDKSRQDKWIQGYVEPEVGYWSGTLKTTEQGAGDLFTSNSVKTKDLLVGLNLIGVVPYRNVDLFIGAGAGLHRFDVDVTSASVSATVHTKDSKNHFGANAQFGLDLHLSQRASFFGAGRFDLVQGAANTTQTKVILGLRFGLS